MFFFYEVWWHFERFALVHRATFSELTSFLSFSPTRRPTRPRCAAMSICARLTPPRTSCPTRTSPRCRSRKPMRCIVPKGRPNRCWCDGVIIPREATARRAPRRSPVPWDRIVSMGKVLVYVFILFSNFASVVVSELQYEFETLHDESSQLTKIVSPYSPCFVFTAEF